MADSVRVTAKSVGKAVFYDITCNMDEQPRSSCHSFAEFRALHDSLAAGSDRKFPAVGWFSSPSAAHAEPLQAWLQAVLTAHRGNEKVAQFLQPPKRVVVVGGGFAGVYLLQALQKDLKGGNTYVELVLVDRKDFFEINFVSLRASLDPEHFAHAINIAHSDALPHVRVIHDSVKRVDNQQVVLSNGDTLRYDALALCTGTSNGMRMARTPADCHTRADRIRQHFANRDEIAQAHSVLLVGGGPTGVELAGEILHRFPDKKVTLMQSNAALIPTALPSAQAKTKRWLERNGCRLLLNDRVEGAMEYGAFGETRTFRTKQGHTVEADLAYQCYGLTPNTGFLREGQLQGALNDRGFIRVDNHFSVKGHDNVFALGDCCDMDVFKQAFIAKFHAATVSHNVVRYLHKGAGSGYKSSSAWKKNLMMVSLGPNAGVGSMHYFKLGHWVTATVKSRGMFVSATYGELGLPAADIKTARSVDDL